jgi:hypothetical protein
MRSFIVVINARRIRYFIGMSGAKLNVVKGHAQKEGELGQGFARRETEGEF